VVLGINGGNDSPEEMQLFADAFQITFPILDDTTNITIAYRQTGALSPFPLDYVIDRQGNVAYFATEYDPVAMSEVIDELLEAPVAVQDAPQVAPTLTVGAVPNPFNPATRIHFELPDPAAVTLVVHDTRGRQVRRLLQGRDHPAGRHALAFDGRDDQGRALASGVYLVRLQAGAQRSSAKLTLTR
jgi:hypothetical protein